MQHYRSLEPQIFKGNEECFDDVLKKQGSVISYNFDGRKTIEADILTLRQYMNEILRFQENVLGCQMVQATLQKMQSGKYQEKPAPLIRAIKSRSINPIFEEIESTKIVRSLTNLSTSLSKKNSTIYVFYKD